MRRDEQQSIKAVKLMMHSDKVRDTQTKKQIMDEVQNETYQEIIDTKMRIATLNAERKKLDQ